MNMQQKQWYEELFENYGKQYDKECFTQGTLGECDFLEQELAHNKQRRILDIGCGTGRHAIELTKRGYSNVRGVDLSESQIARAKEKASAEQLDIDFRVADARNLPFEKEFDLIIMLCEGGFPLMETDEMNFEILQNARDALAEGGKLIFTTLNGLFPIFNSVQEFMKEQKEEGNASCDKLKFNLMTFRETAEVTAVDDNGKEKVLQTNERWYMPVEISWLLKTLGFTQIEIFAAHLGDFSREHALTINDFEMLVIAN
ncbi:class I SAM-dependent methyltransferase [Photobacterium sp. SDRW27]|uniref:class I SAM-dependent methyltransferase n=1 Tax=Photobacterium obscurum TaxID=2829490 RepID=UPI002244E6F4|nr:class I SAM-dependent methyltransferase [Photobacterium obscurum]MCW8327625.1 class I SAM-dependent methyltransferase [Photobacterium obscurum]